MAQGAEGADVKAIDYIRKGWTQNRFARDADGKGTTSWYPEAVCWCAQGAINAAYHHYEDARKAAFDAFAKVIGITAFVDWNDSPERTHVEVIEAFEKAGI